MYGFYRRRHHADRYISVLGIKETEQCDIVSVT